MAETDFDDGPPIGFDGENVIFSARDADLIGLVSPSPIDVVADRAWESLGRFQQHSAELSAEIYGVEATVLGSGEQWWAMQRQLEATEKDIARLRVFCQAVGAVSLQRWMTQKEK